MSFSGSKKGYQQKCLERWESPAVHFSCNDRWHRSFVEFWIEWNTVKDWICVNRAYKKPWVGTGIIHFHRHALYKPYSASVTFCWTKKESRTLWRSSLHCNLNDILSWQIVGKKINSTYIKLKDTQHNSKCTHAGTTIDLVLNHEADVAYSVNKSKKRDEFEETVSERMCLITRNSQGRKGVMIPTSLQ